MSRPLIYLKALPLIVLLSQSLCWATDYYPIGSNNSSVVGAGGNNSEQVNMAIAQSGLPPESRNVTATYRNGAIVLTGTVADDRDRQEIGSIAAKCGCVNIKNEITVRSTTPIPSRAKSYKKQ